jgi:hypothetical protein
VKGMGMGTKGVGVPLEQQLHIINPCPAAVTLTATVHPLALFPHLPLLISSPPPF